ncbi:hypothetical protein MPER_14726, partial [Moniliophthora perniciosa FA553]
RESDQVAKETRPLWGLKKPMSVRESRSDEEVNKFPRGLDTSEPEPRQNTCQNPAIRKEWRKLSPSEQNDYLTAVKCLYTSPTKGIYPDVPFVRTRMDDLAWTHSVVQEQIHL